MPLRDDVEFMNTVLNIVLSQDDENDKKEKDTIKKDKRKQKQIHDNSSPKIPDGKTILYG